MKKIIMSEKQLKNIIKKSIFENVEEGKLGNLGLSGLALVGGGLVADEINSTERAENDGYEQSQQEWADYDAEDNWLRSHEDGSAYANDTIDYYDPKYGSLNERINRAIYKALKKNKLV